MRPLTRMAILVTVLMPAGCAGHPTRAAAPAPAAPATAPATATPPASCGRPSPRPDAGFKLNRDAATRDSLVSAAKPLHYVGGAASFGGLDAAGLDALLAGHFIAPWERQNEAPTAWQILQFLCGHPEVRAAGHVISADRDDYRTTIDDISADRADARLGADAEKFCAGAETEVEPKFECFWD